MPATKNILGPDPNRGATLTRPARTTGNYNAPYWCKTCTNPADPNNTKITEDMLNDLMAFGREMVGSSGVSEVEGASGDEMGAEAMARYASLAVGSTCTNSGNAYTVAKLGATVVPKALFTGMLVLLIPSATNTGAATANVFGLGAKAVRTFADTALAGGELIASQPTMLCYSAAANGGSGAWLILPWGGAAYKPPGFAAVNSGNTACPHATDTKVASLTSVTRSFFLDPASTYASSRFTCGPLDAGLWRFEGYAALELLTAPSGNEWQLGVRKNANSMRRSHADVFSNVATHGLTANETFDMADGDYVELVALQHTGATRNVTAARLAGFRIGVN